MAKRTSDKKSGKAKAKRVRLGHYVYRGHQIVRDDISRDWDVFIDDESPFVCSELTLKDAMAGLDRILDRKAAATAPPVESKQVRIDPAKQPRGFRHGCRRDGRDSDMPPRKFVVMGQWAWGVGETIDEATKQYRKVGGSGRRGKDFKVFLTPEFATEVSVDGMGNILWTGPNNEIVEVS